MDFANRPDQLILPYDPGFIPDLSLPGLDIDLSNLQPLSSLRTLTLESSLLSATISNSSNVHSQDADIPPYLDISSSTFSFGDVGGLDLMSGGVLDAAQRATTHFTGRQSEVGNEGGILLQPDFEFDEDGNIVDLFEKERREIVDRHHSLLPSGFQRADPVLHRSHLEQSRAVSSTTYKFQNNGLN